MSEVRRCPGHGWFALETGGGTVGCPDCGAPGEAVVDGDRRTRLSRFVSGVLRHFPRDVGLTLDAGGWVRRGDLAAAVVDRYGWATSGHLDAVVATDPKGRFEVRTTTGMPARPRTGLEDDDRVRAAYGHSVSVDLSVGADGTDTRAGADPEERSVPDRLYHGTAPGNREAIEREGLQPMGRQSVHLSGSVETARAVGRRHASDPLVFVVDVPGLREAGYEVTKRGRETFLTDHVPPAVLSVHDSTEGG